jgi:hypothetical protein
MTVTIPTKVEHEGYPGNLMTVEIADTCPQCGGPRGTKRWGGLSYDGSRRLNVDCWSNPCGHVDTYAAVRQEIYNSKNTANASTTD